MVDFICHLIIYGFVWLLAYLFCLGVVANYQSRIAHLIDPERYREGAEDEIHYSLNAQAAKAGAVVVCLVIVAVNVYPRIVNDHDPANAYNTVESG